MKRIKNPDQLIGQTKYYICTGAPGGIEKGVITRTTKSFCILETERGESKRKAVHLLFSTEDEAKLNVINMVTEFLDHRFEMSIFEMGGLFKEMLEKYPEKFV